MARKTDAGRDYGRPTKKRKPAKRAAATNEPSAAFLAALEAQRASHTTPAPEPTPAPTPRAMPGFYYDAEQKKYFRGKPPAKTHLSLHKLVVSTPTASSARRFDGRSNVATFLSMRQVRAEWTSRHDHDLARLVWRKAPCITSLLSPVYRPVDMALAHGRLAVADATGSIAVCELTEAGVQSSVEIAADAALQMTRVQWQRAYQSSTPALGYTALGGANRPGFLRVHRENTLLYNQALQDAWCLAWHPHKSTHVAVGATHKKARAMVVDIEHNQRVRGPSSSANSDVFAQAFLSCGQVLLNGTRSGVAWLWDLRAHTACLQLNLPRAASISDVAILRNDVSCILGARDGGIERYDLRALRAPVLTYALPAPAQAHATRLAVDANETVLCGHASAHEVGLWDVDSGHLLSRALQTPADAQLVGVALDATCAWRVRRHFCFLLEEY
ncbi:hypothetical protein SPRG_08168 [Saprolegnia parasitica CBS 223.65]|uniref:Anaphase-promoting complex subunit 4 WD40 domain-containing protein n=1 Tax=Saprolegnia parasitica (strain CBS 223.65) TaxID=695850 RepID=A0A067CB06_SAPPC|nr:hypothetical protein SPRG_08168 [Saprolegnia parasitica CBS 223.65]KDO26365.1 hypothetical protein SPRG_08168 [Saprolegnia parasitica CBS 223.65]|eukprot:XP_012202803.1 hypothetical protein SPRG_08168 [Saprolegnia parasitica CBS 223.65]